jgi:hypothetical protein
MRYWFLKNSISNTKFAMPVLGKGLPWRGVIIARFYPLNTRGTGAIEFNLCMPGLGQGLT